MRFILQLARWETRASWRRLLFFFICIGVGVASIVAVRSMIQNVNRGVSIEARQLSTADVQVDSDHAWTPEVLAAIDRISAPLIETRVETIESVTMARPASADREGAIMIELKGIQSPFPLYGQIELTDGQAFSYSLLDGNGALVGPSFLERLGLKVGDQIKIGDGVFQIRGVILHEPGGGGGFRLGPRVFIERSAVEAAGLTGFASRARRRLLFKTKEGEMETLASRLNAELKNKVNSIKTYRDSQENVKQNLDRAENYMSLMGLVILVLGGIGISNVTRVFVEQKKKAIAVMKCLGGKGRQITSAYVLQVLVLGLAGSLLGVFLARLVMLFVSKYYAASLPRSVSYGLTIGAVAQGVSIGLLISILFSALPLLRIRRIRPNMLLREDERTPGRRFDPWRWGTGAVVVIGLIAIASWQAGSIRIGLFFLGGVAVTGAVLQLAAVLLIYIVRRVRGSGPFAFRQAINSLHRPGNQTRVIIMAVGLGAFLIIAVQALKSNMLRNFNLEGLGKFPVLVLIDIQKDQEQGIKEFVQQALGKTPEMIPVVRAHILAINGREIDFEELNRGRERNRVNREYGLTYRAGLWPNESIVQGKLWDASPAAEPEVSIEEGVRDALGLGLGGTITFEIETRKVGARVTSVRKVNFNDPPGGFAFLFRPGSLEDLPQMLIAQLDGPRDDAQRASFQRQLVDKYPNVAAVDLADIVRVIEKFVNTAGLAVSFVGALVFLSGALILIGAIAMTKFQRIYEVAVLKTLGAKRKTLLAILLGEYGLMGLVAGLIGSAGGAALSYVVSRFVLEVPWTFTPGANLLGIGGTVLLVTVVGALASFDALTRKPLAILRAE
ncbi:MAG TPA: FtsX-like permease family protein [Blastocatellia bacterium]|nr:FtsX-like permease family protein [Blastocatellia bacterium]